VARTEAVGVDAGKINRGRLAALTPSSILDPNRRVAARRIEGLNGSLVFPVDEPIGPAAEHVAQLLRDPLVDRQRWGVGGGRGRGPGNGGGCDLGDGGGWGGDRRRFGKHWPSNIDGSGRRQVRGLRDRNCLRNLGFG